MKYGVIFFALFVLAGCDGQYVYPYHGTLYRPDGRTPAADTQLLVTATPLSKDSTDWSNDNRMRRTDTAGYFSGTMYQSTGWIFPIRPIRLGIDPVYVYTAAASEPIVCTLSDETVTSTERSELTLGRVVEHIPTRSAP